MMTCIRSTNNADDEKIENAVHNVEIVQDGVESEISRKRVKILFLMSMKRIQLL